MNRKYWLCLMMSAFCNNARKNAYLILFLLCFCLISEAQQPGRLMDMRDGKVYKTVTIGSQVWMSENLAYKTKDGSWSYDNRDSNETIYGYLYIWDTACKVCPSGWHLPADEEWKVLERSLGMSETEANMDGFRGDSAHVGGKLKSRSGWVTNHHATTDAFGFKALPGGNYGSMENQFYLIGRNAMFWTSTPVRNEFAWYRDLDHEDGKVFRGYRGKKLAFSVRCIQDK